MRDDPPKIPGNPDPNPQIPCVEAPIPAAVMQDMATTIRQDYEATHNPALKAEMLATDAADPDAVEALFEKEIVDSAE